MAKSSGSLISFSLIPIVATIVGFIVSSAAAVLFLQANVNADHLKSISNTIAEETAQQINVKETMLKAQLTRIAGSSMLIDALQNGTAKKTESEALLSTIIPYAIRVRLFGLNEAKIERDGYPPFSFTSLDLVNRVEAGELVHPEAINADGRWIISVATPIKHSADAEVKGTLFVYFNIEVLTKDITKDDAAGLLQIVQEVGNAAAKPIVSLGSGDGPTVTRPVNNKNWQVTFAPSDAILNDAPANIIYYLVPGALMLIFGLVGIFVGASRTAAALDANLSKLGKQISRIAVGHYEHERYTLPGFDDQDAKLEPLLDLSARPAAKKPDKPKIGKPAQKKSAPEMVDIEMVDDEEIEDLVEDEQDDDNSHPESNVDINTISHIFRANDIRGLIDTEITTDVARLIGLAVGSAAEDEGEQTILVGYDGRTASPALAQAVIEGLVASGRDVINIGATPTPVMYYATHCSDARSGIMVTGSHNKPDYNGFKVVIAGQTLLDTQITDLYTRIRDENFTSGEGVVSEIDLSANYIEAITDDVVVAQPLRVVVDCGNGIAGQIAIDLLDSLGCEAIPLYCEVDGSFPNHNPDPTDPDNLEDLILTVKSQGADLGIALDGDGDRIVAVTASGQIVWPDRLLMLFAKDVVSRNPGSDVVYDVKCSRHLNSVISGFGGRPIICRSGHSFIKAKIKDTDAMLGGEFGGHICFSERWYGFDDGLYSAARLLEIVGAQEEGLEELLQEFPLSVSTPEIHIPVDDATKFQLIKSMVAAADFEDANINTIDGLRIDFSDGWGLVRASNTEPALTLRFEADDQAALDEIQTTFREFLQEIRKGLTF